MRILLVVVGTLVVLTGCGMDTSADVPTRSTAEPSTSTVDPAYAPAEESGASPPEPSANPPSAPETVELAETPSLPEGPYYPTDLDRPSDRDSNLLLLSGSPVVATGEPLLLRGQLLDVDGSAISGAVIEIWQADSQGIYLHPDDPRADARDPYFQSFGEATTDASGTWTFRTIRPAVYEDRPQHIHLKVRHGQREVLTTQIFFAGDPRIDRDPMLTELDRNLASVVVSAEPGTDDEGQQISEARHTLVVDLLP